MSDYKEKIVEKIDTASNKIVQINTDRTKIKYDEQIVQHRRIEVLHQEEEYTRANIISKLVNELGYQPDKIEIEKEYAAGRPSTLTPRIDLILRDSNGDCFFFMEIKAPGKFETDKSLIEGQLFNLARLETTHVKYLVYYTVNEEDLSDNAIIIDYEKYSEYEEWAQAGYPSVADELPSVYGQPQKEPYTKGGDKDLKTHFTAEEMSSIRRNLHNVLWAGGGTSDNDIFSALVNIILAKIQDETEKADGERYDFQVIAHGDDIERPSDLFRRVNELYRRALKDRLYITDVNRLSKAYVVNEEKFSLANLLYAVQQLEHLSFVAGRNSITGKDLLGEFFEGIIREGFKQTKGQFFTPINIVQFMYYAMGVDDMALDLLDSERRLPRVIDPSCGSGTFLIEIMRLITKSVKYDRKQELSTSRQVQEKFEELFMPDNRENRWARDYIYGVELNFDLGTATKVNMILHGDGSSNIFANKDGLALFNSYVKPEGENLLQHSSEDPEYKGVEGRTLKVNGQFDVIITNPPFSVDLTREQKRSLLSQFAFSTKKNSENLFIERWYQLLRPGGRVGAVLPESVFDTTENKYIRLFLYKYFKINAIISLPQVTFEPYTQTKTSILFATKKSPEEVEEWNESWHSATKEWSNLKTKVDNYIKVLIQSKEQHRYSSIKDDTGLEIQENIKRFLKDYIVNEDAGLTGKELLTKYEDEIKVISKIDKDTKEMFGHVNTWWVLGEVANAYDQPIFMGSVDNVGYKRTKVREKKMPNELFQRDEAGKLIIDADDTLLKEVRENKVWQ
jgi:type I restriction enzyme M protein